MMKALSLLLLVASAAIAKSPPEYVASVSVARGSSTANGKKLSVGAKIKYGDHIQVAEDSGLFMQFGDDYLVILAAGTSLRILEVGSKVSFVTRFQIETGSLFYKSRKGVLDKVEVADRNVVAFASDATYAFNVGKNSKVSLLRGQLWFKPRGKSLRALKAGSKVTISRRAKVRRLNKNELRTLRDLEQVKSSTF